MQAQKSLFNTERESERERERNRDRDRETETERARLRERETNQRERERERETLINTSCAFATVTALWSAEIWAETSLHTPWCQVQINVVDVRPSLCV